MPNTEGTLPSVFNLRIKEKKEMLELLKNEANKTLTENGAVAYEHTGSDCLDLFARIGAMRHQSEKEILDVFKRAFYENRNTALKILFYARDIRGGLGERRVFRLCLRYLAKHHKTSVIKNLCHIFDLGRCDDILELMYTPCEAEAIALIKEEISKDLASLERGEGVSLLAKWLPSVNTSNKRSVALAKHIAKQLGMSQAEYRRTLSKLRAKIKIIETSLTNKDYTFSYDEQPSVAMLKYHNAFLKNDGQRYREYLSQVIGGEKKINTGTLCPYDVVKSCFCGGKFFNERLSHDERAAIDTTWKSLPSIEGEDNALVVIDTSGSMYWGSNPTPIVVAISLGIYLAEHCKGEYKNHFISFSQRPRLIKIKGNDLYEKVDYICSREEAANTDIEKVFDLVLSTAVKNNLSSSELPKSIIIVSDMEFDTCAENSSLTNFESARLAFEGAGYALPKIVFWNVNSRNSTFSVNQNTQGAYLVSGCTPRLFSMVASNKINPYELMMEIIDSPRYEKISA